MHDAHSAPAFGTTRRIDPGITHALRGNAPARASGCGAAAALALLLASASLMAAAVEAPGAPKGGHAAKPATDAQAINASEAKCSPPLSGKPASEAKGASPLPPCPQVLLDINSASKAELLALGGISEQDAQHIIDNRPYASLEELRASKMVKPAQFDKIAARITVKPAAQPASAPTKGK